MAYTVRTATFAKAQSSSATSVAPTFAANLTSGDLCFMVFGGRGAVSTVTDTGSQAWTKMQSKERPGAGHWLEVWTAPVTAAGTAPTVTVTKTGGADFMGALIFAIGGLDTTGSGQLDTQGSFAAGSGGPTADVPNVDYYASSREQSGFCLLTGFADGGQTFTTATGYLDSNSYTSIGSFSNPLDVCAFYRDATFGLTESAIISLSGAEGCCAIIGVWKTTNFSSAVKQRVQLLAQPGGATGTPYAFDKNVTAGNLIVVTSRCNSGSGNTMAISDSLGNTYVDGTAGDSGESRLQQHYCLSSLGGANSITLTCSGGNTGFVAVEYSGPSAWQFDLEATPNGSGSGTVLSTNSFTPTADDLTTSTWVTLSNHEETCVVTGSAYLVYFVGNPNVWSLADNLAASAGSQSVTWTVNNSTTGATRNAMCFKSPSGPVTLYLLVKN